MKSKFVMTKVAEFRIGAYLHGRCAIWYSWHFGRLLYHRGKIRAKGNEKTKIVDRAAKDRFCNGQTNFNQRSSTYRKDMNQSSGDEKIH